VAVHDFYENLTPAEKPYLHQLHSPGNCLDMMKTKAILDNANCRHLQLDSNTIITNYNALYMQTFLAEEQQDAMNASCYGTTLVTTHNKIVYTHPESMIQAPLLKMYNKEMERSTSPSMNNESRFYNAVFINATRQADLTAERSPTAILKDEDGMPVPEYRITANVLTVTTQSWSNQQDIPEELNLNLPTKIVDRMLCDSSMIESLIKKYVLKKRGDLHEQLMSISDVELECAIVRKYFEQCDTEDKTKILKLIPPNAQGDMLCLEAFHTTVSDMHHQFGILNMSKASAKDASPSHQWKTALRHATTPSPKTPDDAGDEQDHAARDDMKPGKI
jgi:hypothetical protein